jgi:GTP cyclohydrolase II
MEASKLTLEDLLREDVDHACGDGEQPCVRISAVAELPTRFGDFRVVAFHSPSDGKEHAALIRGAVIGQERVPVRLHSECLTGDVFGSLRCDCRQQLELALEEIDRRGSGVLLYLRQEGRGIGFENKIRAYRLQELGLDTIEANEALGFKADERDYAVAAHMLYSLRVQSIDLLSNNPAKIADLKAHGTKVIGRIPLQIPPNPYNEKYLETKRVKAGHLLKPPMRITVREQLDALDGASTSSDASEPAPGRGH